MCEIQIIKKLGREKINKADVGEFFKMMCFGSMHNNDAFGFFNHNTMFKNRGAFDASKLDEYDLTMDNFIVGHNRFSTHWSDIKHPVAKNTSSKVRKLFTGMSKSTRHKPMWNWSKNWKDNMCDIFLPTAGWNINLEDEEPEIGDDNTKETFTHEDLDNNRNHHPFKLRDFTLIHNGTISNAQDIHDEYNFQTNINTDSYVILELIDYFFKKSSIKDRVRRIASAISSTCEKLEGKYSVVLYDKRGKNTFYFKNSLAFFSLCKYGDSILCGSTSQENLNYLYFGMDREDIYIRNKRVYMITSNADNPVVDVTPSIYRTTESQTLYDILKETDYYKRKNDLDVFLKKNLGFIPLYYITIFGKLKISRNDTYGIKDKIHTIVKNPKRFLGWYTIKASDIKPVVSCKKKTKVKKQAKSKKVKLDKMKGGKNKKWYLKIVRS